MPSTAERSNAREGETNPGGYVLFLDARGLGPERDAQILSCLSESYSIVMATDTPDVYRHHEIAHIIHTTVGDYEVAAADIRGYVERHKLRIAGIVYWKDREVELASVLAAAFNVVGNTLLSVRSVRDKVFTRQILQSIPGANPKHHVLRREEDIETGLRHVGTPCLIKPAGNSGSRGIVRLGSVEGAKDRYREFVADNARNVGDMYRYYQDHALLEEELSGSEHSVAGLVCDGNVAITAIADKEFDRTILMQYQNIVPSRLPNAMQTEMVELVTRAVSATGMKYGGFHVDVMVTSDGPRVLEIGGRLGGELINSHLVPLALSGFSPYAAFLRIAVGESVSLPCDLYKRASMRAAVRIIRPPRPGQITAVRGLERVAKHPATRLVFPALGPGDTACYPQVVFKRFEVAYVVLQAHLTDDIDSLLAEVGDLVSVEMLQ